MITTMVENWPGYRDGIMGPDLMEEMRMQAQRFGATIVAGRVTKVDLDSRPVPASGPTTANTARRRSSSPPAPRRKWLGLLSERRLVGHGVSSCATCDGAFFKDRPIAVVGGGDTAMEEALFLTRFASKVTVVHRRDKLRASKVMQDKAFANPKIEFVWNSEIEEILDVDKGEVTGVVVRNLVTGADLAARRGRRVRRDRPHAEHGAVQGAAGAEPERLHRHQRHAHQRRRRVRRWATCRTTPTGRRSRRRDRAAWPRWTPSGSSRTWIRRPRAPRTNRRRRTTAG